ncbi:MAG: hypothetical protein IH612_11030, partial [Desulfofustis sp.]|nr:hypothetical protein [Desulfofustis sp.]
SMSDRRPALLGSPPIARAGAVILACLLILSVCSTASAAQSRQQCTALLPSWLDNLDRDDRELIIRRTRDQCLGAAHWMKQQTLDGGPQVKRQICRDLVLIWTFKEREYRRDYIDRQAYAPCMDWSREMHRRCLADDLAWFEAADGDDRGDR